jgi:hypothetical protein
VWNPKCLRSVTCLAPRIEVEGLLRISVDVITQTIDLVKLVQVQIKSVDENDHERARWVLA